MKIFRNPALLAHMNCLNLRFPEAGDVCTDRTWGGVGVCSAFSRLYLVTGGEGYLTYGEETVPLTPGHAYLIPAGLRYSYGTADSVEKLYFHLNLTRPDGYDYFCGLERVAAVSLPREDGVRLRALFRGEDASGAALTTELYVCRLLSRLLDTVTLPPARTRELSPLVVGVIAYVHDHLSCGLRVEEVAEAFFLSAGYLTRRFREEVGSSVAHYIEDQVFRAAEEALLCEDRSLGEISASLGFCDQFYFSRRFRERFGVPPSAYRRSLRAGQ